MLRFVGVCFLVVVVVTIATMCVAARRAKSTKAFTHARKVRAPGPTIVLVSLLCLVVALSAFATSTRFDHKAEPARHREGLQNFAYTMQQLLPALWRFEPPDDTTTAAPFPIPQCARWSPEVRARINERCGVWASYIGEWVASTRASTGSVVYACDANCTGLGDRLVGLVGVLNVAMYEGRALRVQLPSLASALEPCALQSYASAWNAAVDHPADPRCDKHHLYFEYLRDANTCAFFPRRDSGDQCSFSPGIANTLVNVNRPCVRPRICNALRSAFRGNLTAADIVGCPLRLLMEPSERFVAEQRFEFRLDGQVRSMSVRDIALALRRYHVIAVQIRTADDDAKATMGNESEWRLPLRCAHKLQTYHAKVSGGGAAAKPVRWLVLTNHVGLHARLLGLVGDKLLQFTRPPEHMRFMTSHLQEATLIAEWYIAGLADKHVLSDFVYGNRPSALMTTALLYNMRSTWIRASSCTEEPLPAFNTNLDVSCRSAWTEDWEPWSPSRHYHAANASKQTPRYMAQPHLQV